MTTETDIKTLLRSEIATRMDVPEDSIADDTHLADLGIDSLQALQILVLMERSFAITLTDEDLQHFRDIQSLANLVGQRMQQTAAATA